MMWTFRQVGGISCIAAVGEERNSTIAMSRLKMPSLALQ
jgi:hypothetical protein